jgi:hypothetical protein
MIFVKLQEIVIPVFYLSVGGYQNQLCEINYKRNFRKYFKIV